MANRTRRSVSLGTSALVLLAAPAAGQAREVKVGEELFALRLPTIDGATVDLARYRGRKLLLIEFASW